MINIDHYIRQLIDMLRQQYDGKLLYVGLQGSYLRGEATDSSDMDIMVVLDHLSVTDLDCYRDIILSLEQPDKSCGFICSRTDLANWNPLEICHLVHSTKDYYGTLKPLVPAYTNQDVRNYIKLSINNLYHEICHRYIHAGREKSAAMLPGAYRGVFFILQNLYYLEHGVYILTKAALLPLLSGADHAVLDCAMKLGDGGQYDFDPCFQLLFTWCQHTLKRG